MTFQETNNYGALLQNYALQQALKKLGHDSETINYKSEYIGKPCKLIHLKKKGLMKYLLGVAGYFIYLPRTKQNNVFRKRIKYTEKVKKVDLDKFSDCYDLYITGSDQVWNYNLTDFDDYYMLGFVKNKKKCNSYAASLGIAEIAEDKKSKFSKYIENYNYISVREQSAKEAIEKVSEHQINVVADPCVLLSQSEWDVVTKEAPTEPYVYVYQLGVSKDVVQLAKRLAKENGLKIIYTPFPVGTISSGKFHVTAGCEDIVTYIKNASYVVTDSFHGTLLSIIYHKEFYTKASGTHGAVGNRITDLLKNYGLEERKINDNLDLNLKIDYVSVQEHIEENRNFAYKALEDICLK